ncbi:universal stress protein [Sporosarcina sp. Te-1]|uniref:universal stress protein n=1 Tax=Sporosarcina sp. Te-1 TaxID=2818390 RepID=UPI001A9DA6E3|nr:universal stress protein [Sporosarcina sp. Te-1]QTD42624.1 universal stress protein [Sporosarcina sp. Te-1]
MFCKILVAIDESDMNNKVLEATLSIADNKKAHVTLVNVSKENVTTGLTYVPEDYLEEVLNDLEKSSIRILEKAKNKLLSVGGMSIEIIHLKGDAAQQILEYAKEHEQELIIIGSRGLSGMKEFMLGSVSHKVAQLSNCPVLIVH